MCESPHIYKNLSDPNVIRYYIFAECGDAPLYYCPMTRMVRYSPEPSTRTRLRGILATFVLFKWVNVPFSRAKLRREIGRINRALVIVKSEYLDLEVRYALRGLRQLYSDKKKSVPRTPTAATQPPVDLPTAKHLLVADVVDSFILSVSVTQSLDPCYLESSGFSVCGWC